MYKVKGRVYGRAADGRVVLLFTPGSVITDEEARRAGLLTDKPALPVDQPRGLTLTAPREEDTPAPDKPLARMTLAELRAVCEAEDIDAAGANLRADYIEAIEAARAELAFEVGPGDED